MQPTSDKSPPDAINLRRIEIGLTEVALATAAGFPVSTLRTKINNFNLFTLYEIKRLGPALGVDYRIWIDAA